MEIYRARQFERIDSHRKEIATKNHPMTSLEERIQAAVREEISIVPYDHHWPRMFEEECVFLRSILSNQLIGRIEHFGSTAVPGLAAKPIIDLLVEVSSLDETQSQIVPLLETAGYDYFWRTDESPPYAWFIKRNAEGGRTHHIHMVEADSKLWERLLFRDYLRQFPDEAKRYEQLKMVLAENHPRDRIAYTKAKTDYVVGVTETARQYFSLKQ